MKLLRRALPTAALVLGAALLAIPGRADDWPQFRHDAARTGASSDPVRLPLTEVWARPGGACAIWRGRAYFVTTAGGLRTLVCADARPAEPSGPNTSSRHGRALMDRIPPNLVQNHRLDQPPRESLHGKTTAWSAWGARPRSLLPPGHLRNGGLAIVEGRVIGVLQGSIAAIELATGNLAWRQKLPVRAEVRSLVATPDHLLISTQGGLAALRLRDGAAEWSTPLPAGGDLSLANGLVFMSEPTGYGLARTAVRGAQRQFPSGLHAFAPAERTYRLALDSERPGDYAGPGATDEGGKGAGEQGRKGEGTPEAGGPLADASVLRLRFDQPVEELVERAKARRAAAKEVPLLLSLDWLDATRVTLLGPQKQPVWTAERAEQFVRTCAHLARATRPEYFEVGCELNVYVTRRPEELPKVVELMLAARAAIRAASPGTQVLISLNAELLHGRYGKAGYRPFGDLPKSAPLVAELQPLVEGMDAVGLTSHPQAAFPEVLDLPGNYLLALREQLGQKPLLLTRFTVRMDKPYSLKSRQLDHVRRLLQLCYWVDASLMVYPEIRCEAPEGELAARLRDPNLPALGHWNDVLAFRRVDRLSAAPPRPGEEEEEEKAVVPEGDPPQPPGGSR